MAEPNHNSILLHQPLSHLSPQDVADRILGFVDKRLQSEAAAGASQEKLTISLESGKAGRGEGFGRGNKSKRCPMNEDLDNGISQSFGLVNSGLDELAKKYLQSDQATALMSSRSW